MKFALIILLKCICGILVVSGVELCIPKKNIYHVGNADYAELLKNWFPQIRLSRRTCFK